MGQGPGVVSLVRTALRAHSLLAPGRRVLVAVSGGQDSLALAESLRVLNASHGWSALTLAHCNHRWPGDEGIADHVAAYAARTALPLVIADAATGGDDGDVGVSEGSARDWRYRVLSRLARREGFDDVVTGHTRTDLAETALFNLVHGAGAEGLGALTWSRPLEPLGASATRLVRPMLAVSREQTAAFCAAQGIPVWRDAYNDDPRFARNRIRADVMPLLQTFNPNAESALARTAQLLREDAALLEEQSFDLFSRCVTGSLETGVVHLCRAQLARAPVSLQRRVLRRVLREFTGMNEHAAVFLQVEGLRALLSAPVGTMAASLPRGASARVAGEESVEIRIRDEVALVGARNRKGRIPGAVVGIEVAG